MSAFVEQLPLWLSFFFTAVGVIVSVFLAWLAYKGVLFGFTLLLTLGILVLGALHLLQLADPEWQEWGPVLEMAASAIFLIAAAYMGSSLRKILHDK